MIVVLAEKPSVARDIAKVVGASSRREGYWEGAGYQVTWSIGYLVGLAEPGAIRPEWLAWKPALLPMLPDRVPLAPRPGLEGQLRVVAKLFNARATSEVICATDAGREGELIFRLIYEIVECQRPVRRLWISSLTSEAIAAGLRAMKPGRAYDDLAAAARVRAESDWLVGMNLSRACSLATGHRFQVGRVKTPTLAMVVARDIVIERFVPEPYVEVEGLFRTPVGEVRATYVRQAYDDKGKPCWDARLPPLPRAAPAPEEAADQVLARLRAGVPSIVNVDASKAATRPPLLFDLTELQRSANRLWGWTAQRTLGVAQALYEQKALSYPRTDSRHLSQAVAVELPRILDGLRPAFGALVPPQATPLGPRWVDDKEVGDHHALIPTGTVPRLEAGTDAARLYDLVCRRLLAAFHEDAIDAKTTLELLVRSSAGLEDRYQADGKSCERPGWRLVDGVALGQRKKEDADPPGGLKAGLNVQVVDGRVVDKETKAPARFTEASLLTAMETAGSALDKELSRAMKERGLGTPATRAATIEELVNRGYLLRDGKLLRSTPLGVALIASVDPTVASPALTGEWEFKLRKVERGEMPPQQLVHDVHKFVREAVAAALANGVAPQQFSSALVSGPQTPRQPSRPSSKTNTKGRAAKRRASSNARH